ncbi:MAG: hypothetical protein U0Q18_04035 [Bryobacteraceae bacterium]
MQVAQLDSAGLQDVVTEPDVPTIAVLVYNYAAVSPGVLADTEAEAARVYLRAGIRIEWLDCPLTPNDAVQFPMCHIVGPTALVLRILPPSMSEHIRQANESIGLAMLPEDGSFAIVANVFWYDAKRLADRHGMRYGLVLGHIAAHEIGHLLLGPGSHSLQGIMRAPWRPNDLYIMAGRSMLFTPSEASRMRTNIRARCARNCRMWDVSTTPPANRSTPEIQWVKDAA